MANALMKYETIDDVQVEDIMNGREPRPPEGWEDTGTLRAQPRQGRCQGRSEPGRRSAGRSSEH